MSPIRRTHTRRVLFAVSCLLPLLVVASPTIAGRPSPSAGPKAAAPKGTKAPGTKAPGTKAPTPGSKAPGTKAPTPGTKAPTPGTPKAPTAATPRAPTTGTPRPTTAGTPRPTTAGTPRPAAPGTPRPSATAAAPGPKRTGSQQGAARPSKADPAGRTVPAGAQRMTRPNAQAITTERGGGRLDAATSRLRGFTDPPPPAWVGRTNAYGVGPPLKDGGGGGQSRAIPNPPRSTNTIMLQKVAETRNAQIAAQSPGVARILALNGAGVPTTRPLPATPGAPAATPNPGPLPPTPRAAGQGALPAKPLPATPPPGPPAAPPGALPKPPSRLAQWATTGTAGSKEGILPATPPAARFKRNDQN